MHIIKCLLVLFIYRKNLVESADKSAGASPSHGPAPASTNSGSDQGLGTRKDAKAGSSSTAEPKTASTGTPGSGENPKKDGKTSRVASPEDTRTDKSANNTQLSASSPPAGGSATPKSRSQQPSSQPGARTGTQGGGTSQQANSQSAGQTSETSVTQPKSSPTSQSQTGSQSSSSSSLPKQSADSQSGNASQQQSTPAARAGSQQPSGQSNRTGQSASSQPAGGVGFQQSAGSPATRTLQSASSPPASPTSGTDGSPKAGETPKKTGVELCIKKNKEATDQFDYKKDNNVVTYTAKEDYGFKLVKQENIEIWKAKDEKGYARKVVLKGKGKGEKTVTVYMSLGTTDQFRKEGKGKPWNVAGLHPNQPGTKKDTSSGGSQDWWDKITGWFSSLNCSGCSCGSSTSTPPVIINSGGGSDGTGTRTSGGTGTGTGGSTHTGSTGPGAKTGGSAQSGGGTTPPSNESSGTHTSSDGTSRQGSTASSQPNQQRSAQQTGKSQNTPTELQASAYPKNIKLFKADPSDATKTKELTTDEYKVKKMDNEHLYEFNEDVNCTLIKRDDKDVWTYDSSKSNSKYPKGFSFERFIFIYFNGCTDVYDKIDNEWVLCVSLRLYINKPDVVDSGQLDLASIPIYCAPT